MAVHPIASASSPQVAHRGEVSSAPSEWTPHHLGDPDVATIVMGQSPSSTTYNVARIGLPFYQGKADFGLRYPTATVWCSSPSRTASPGDILISVRAPVGDVNLADAECCIGRGLAAITPGPKATAAFLFFLLFQRKRELDALGSGSTFKAINKDALATLEICLPSMLEQQGIATILTTLQEALEVQQRVVARLKELRVTTMAKLFREGLRGEPLKQTEIGEIPESWQVRRLGEIARIGNGSTPRRTNTLYWEGGSIPWLTSSKVHETIIREPSELVTELATRECHLPLVRGGSIVVAITGQGKTLGNAALVTFDTRVNQHLAFVDVWDSSIAPEFVLTYLIQRYADLRRAGMAGGSTKAALTCAYLHQYQIPLPAAQEQREIAAALLKITEQHNVAERRERACRTLFSAALDLLMTGTVRVNGEALANVT